MSKIKENPLYGFRGAASLSPSQLKSLILAKKKEQEIDDEIRKFEDDVIFRGLDHEQN